MGLSIIPGIILGILQGIFERLPVSSEGQIILFSILFFDISASDALVLSVFFHIGTLLAALTYLRKKVFMLIKNIPSFVRREKSDETKLIRCLVISTIFTIIIGFPIYLLVRSIIDDIPQTAVVFIIGALLILSRLVIKKIPRKESRSYQETDDKDATFVGIITGFSAIPGVSRSGSSVLGLLLRHFKSEDALILSFLMSIPVILAAEIGILIIEGVSFISINVLLVALVFSYITGILTIKLLLNITKKIKPYVFSIIFGIIAISINILFIVVK